MKYSVTLLLIIALNSCNGQQNNTMENHLLTQYISADKDAKVIVLFGGNPYRRDEIIKQLMTIKSVSIYGTLSEEEGIAKMKDLGKVDIVLIGGRYTDQQRINIRAIVGQKYPNTSVTEPGVKYQYSNEAIFNQIIKLTKEP
jgi:hypothetical protein